MKRLGQTWLKDMQRGCLYRWISVLIVIPLFCVCIGVPLFFANRPGVTEQEALWIMVIPGALFLLLILGGTPAILIISIRRRANWLDTVFLPMGLEGRSYTLTGRQYHGRVRGREVDVFFARGPLFKMHISTDLKTRVGVSDAESVSLTLAGIFKKEPLDMPELERHNLVAFAHEDDWAAELIRDHQAVRIMDELIHEDNPFIFRQIHLTARDIMFYQYRSTAMWGFTIEPDQARNWFNQLMRLLEIMEGLPAPREELEESETERQVRSGEFKTGGITAAIIIALIAMSLCALGGAFAFIWLMESGL
ncbi:hypothetical protein ACFLYP_04030 [Chloroflexota bacterium]